MVAEADKDKLRQVQHSDGGVLTSEPHGEHPQEEFGTDTGGGHWERGEGYLRGVLPTSVNLSGLTGGGMPVEGLHDGQATGTFYV